MWKCQGCGEEHEDSFEVCWNCGTSRTGEASPDFRVEHEVAPGPSGQPCPNCGKGGGYSAWSEYAIRFHCAECGYDTSFSDPVRAVAAPEELSCPHCSATMERGAASLEYGEDTAFLRFERGDAGRTVLFGSAKKRAYSCTECGVLIIW